jgi:hypothetical protein
MKNEKYSHRAFPYHGVSFKDLKPEEFNDMEIVGSCFYQEWIEGDKDVVKDIFPYGTKGVTFIRCNLDNIKVPDGCTVKDGTNRILKVQDDKDDWELDAQLRPVKCLVTRG